MYRFIRNNSNIGFKSNLDDLIFFPFGSKGKTYTIKQEPVKNIYIYEKKLAYPIVKVQVDKKFNKLMAILPDLLISDEDDGQSIKEALNEIEKFRQIIKNKYREYLTRKDLEAMSNKMSMLRQQANKRMMEINYSRMEQRHRSSSR